jgi:DNA-directed RNA polymerase subunit beta
MKKICFSTLQLSGRTYSYSLPDMAEAHKQSFFKFLNQGLLEELEKIFPIYLKHGRVQVFLEPKSVTFQAPKLTLKEAFLQRTTYNISVYFLVTFIDLDRNIYKREWLSFGSIPICMSGGWFLVRGLRRVILHQLMRSAGCYASVDIDKNYSENALENETLTPSKQKYLTLSVAKKFEILLIPQQGTWLRFFIKGQGFKSGQKSKTKCDVPALLPYIRWGKKDQYASLFIFLRAMGVSLTQIKSVHGLKGSSFNPLEKNLSSQEALHELGFISKTKKDFGSRRAFYQRFFNYHNYRLGSIGRLRLNRRLGLAISLTNQSLSPDDLLSILNQLAALSAGLITEDDIDHLQNKRLKSCGEFLQDSFHNALKVNVKNFRSTLQDSFSNKPFNNTGNHIKLYLGTENIHFNRSLFNKSLLGKHTNPIRVHTKSCSNVLSNKISKELPTESVSNALSYRITAAYHSFFATSAVSQPAHQTNPIDGMTHARRSTSLGPGGLTREHAGIAVRGIHPSHFGRLCPVETPEGQNTGLVNSPSYCARVNIYGFLETPYWPIKDRRLFKKKGPVYLSPNQENQVWVMPNEVLVSKSGFLPNSNLLSRSGADFAYLPSKDINYFGILPNQVFSLGASLIPFMEHDDGNRALMGSNMQRQAVPILQNERPFVGTGLESVVVSDTRAGIRALASGYVYYVSGKKILIHSLIHWRLPAGVFETIEYQLGRYETTNQGTCIDQKPIIFAGDWVQTGDLLAEGYATKRGELALGRNLCVAYLPWEGYNYEDSVLINESLVHQDILTSIHIEKYETELTTRRVGKNSIQEKLSGECTPKHAIPRLNESQLEKLDFRGVIREGVWVEPNDILVGKLIPTQVELRPEERLVHAIFGTKPPSYQDASFRLPKYVEGRVIRVETFSNKNTDNRSFRIYVAQQRRIQVGDKIAGRHGNKGVISRILPRHDMPYLQNGLDVDIVLNPLGIPSRMNVGQVYEGLLGLVSRYLGRCFRVLPFDENFGSEASRGIVYSQLAKARKKTGQTWLFDPQSSGKSRVFDGRTGEVFEQSVLVTQSYILKLEHQVDEKIHARSTGPYSLITQQPVRGRSRQGGQRLGEMEVWAVEGYGAAYLLYEMLTIKADDLVGRQQAASEILRHHYGPIPQSYEQSNRPESFQVLANELRALCLDFQYPN